MRLGINFGYQDWGTGVAAAVQTAQEAERLGYHSVWTAEAYGTDAVTPLTWLMANTETLNFGSAILQMPARTPAMTAMTAATLDLMSGGRFLLGLGLSGPQVVEGWHGQPYGKPLGKTREYVDIVRTILKREAPLEHHGAHYDIPYNGPDATGLGKPLKIIVHPRRRGHPDLPRGDRPEERRAVRGDRERLAPDLLLTDAVPRAPTARRSTRASRRPAATRRSRTSTSRRPSPSSSATTSTRCAASSKPMAALYIGGMGARGKNFYNDLACRYGFEDAAKKIQDLYLEGNKRDAIAAVPDELVDEISLIGPKERIADRLEAWKESGITTLIVGAQQPEALQLMAELVL